MEVEETYISLDDLGWEHSLENLTSSLEAADQEDLRVLDHQIMEEEEEEEADMMMMMMMMRSPLQEEEEDSLWNERVEIRIYFAADESLRKEGVEMCVICQGDYEDNVDIIGKLPCRHEGVEMCVICQGDYEGNVDIIGKLPCRHDFLLQCIQKWLSRNNLCPLPNTSLSLSRNYSP
ncbi:hypothetical protein M9H77_15034 [Catharanthus roseus]|uniref:Uncharacterized protein n=1 Tax=Catharanthus roseus TaxID=4058 RepID=A0ACC0BPW1_CATRO|nr:hypothetical protein M9H77_15034 [Catharanthus roseus]